MKIRKNIKFLLIGILLLSLPVLVLARSLRTELYIETEPIGPAGDGLVLEAGGYVLLESGDYLLLE